MSTAVNRAVILAAGRGQRLGALTDERPKCLCPLAGRPIVAWTLDALRANGIDEILLVGGWRAETLDELAVHVRVNAGWMRGNMVRSLQCAADWLQSGPTLVVYGDCAYSKAALANAVLPSDDDIVLPFDRDWLKLWGARFDDPLSDAESLIFDAGCIRDIGRRPALLAEIQGQFMGLLRMTPKGWNAMSSFLDTHERTQGAAAVDRLDMTTLLRNMIAAGHTVRGRPTEGGWVEIDSLDDLVAIENALAAGNFSHDFLD